MLFYIMCLVSVFNIEMGGNEGRVLTFSPPTSEAGVWFPAQPQVGKLVVSSALPTTRHDMTCTVLKATVKPQINKLT